MPNFDNSVHYLNADVFNALKTVKDPKAVSVDEATAIKTAILKDGKVDDNEEALIEKLSQQTENTATTNQSNAAQIDQTDTFSGQEIRIFSQGTANSDGEELKMQTLSQEAADALDIGTWDLTVRRAELAVEFIDDEIIQPINKNVVQPINEHVVQPINEHVVQPVVNTVKRLINHIWQYDPSQGTNKENQANCGPASAAIVGENFGLEMPTLSALRSSVGAPRGNGSGAFALSTNQVIRAVEKQGEQQGQNIEGREIPLSTNVDNALEEMRECLDNGEQLILLTSNIAIRSAKSLASGSGKGHYVVVNAVNDDGSIMITDPQKRDGLEITHSREQLQTHLQRRQRFGRPNVLLAFENTTA